MKTKVVLAFSGGLDTSYCVKYLSEEKNMDVYSVFINTGGFSPKECAAIRDMAYLLGVKEHKTIDISKVFYKQCIRYLIYGNVLKNHTYPLSVSSERVFQALSVIKQAKKISAEYIAHGSTGAGNDQIRFDMIFNVISPDIKIIAPVREKRLSRQDEISYLISKGIELNWRESEYSINKGIWGSSIGGKETLGSVKSLPEYSYPTQLSETGDCMMKIKFESGEPIEVNDKKFADQIKAIKFIEKIAGKYAVGRGMHVGDTIIGIKGRVAFEAAAPLIIIKSHQSLEKHVLGKWQIYWKDQIANWYGMMLHEGQYMDPVMRDMEKFLESSQNKVSGIVFIKLRPYHFEISGIESDNDLMDPEYATYGEMNHRWNAEDIKGFTKIMANQMSIMYQSNKKNKEKKHEQDF